MGDGPHTRHRVAGGLFVSKQRHAEHGNVLVPLPLRFYLNGANTENRVGADPLMDSSSDR